MLKLFDLVPSWAYAAAIVALGLLAGLQWGRYTKEVSKHSVTKVAFADFRSEVERRDRLAADDAVHRGEVERELERFRNKQSSEAQNAHHQELALSFARGVDHAERGRLLDNVVDALTARSEQAGGGGADSGALARAEETAAPLGGLLKTCRAEGRSDAEDLERLAAQTRSLIKQYESLLDKPSSAGSTAAEPPRSGSTSLP